MDWSLSKVIRVESGAVGISTNDLRALLNLYEIRDRRQTDELIELARVARQTSWWGKYRHDITASYLQYIEYEEAISVHREYATFVIPGLFQTREYALSVMQRLASEGDSEAQMLARVEIRTARQRLLQREPSPILFAVINEAAIQCMLGDRDVADGQIARLIELANKPDVMVEILPFGAGIRRGMLDPFIVLEFPDPEDSDVLFLESDSREFILSQDEAGEIAGYRELFEELRSSSLGPAGTVAYLENLSR
jgi:Domain of unknown function (DUF5753)